MVHFLLVIRVDDLDFISWINKEILIDLLFMIMLIIFNKVYFLDLDTAIIVPDLLEDVRRLPEEYSNALNTVFILADAVLNLNYCIHVLDDEVDGAVVLLDVVYQLHLPVNVVVIVVLRSFLVGINDD